MFVAPLSYVLKCPNCGGDIPFRDLVDRESLSIRAVIAVCKNCHSRVTLSRTGFLIFTWAMYATLVGILVVLAAPLFFPNGVHPYLPLPALVAMIIALVGLRFTKVKLVRSD